MERSVLHWVCVFALLALPVLGCSDENGGTGGSDLCEGIDCDDGNQCTEDTCTDGMCASTQIEDGTSCGDGAGTCQVGSCVGTFACTEQGIRDAIAVGGGPHAFDCDGPQTVVTEATIVIDNDVILDGEGNLTVDGDLDHTVFISSATTARPVTVTLEGIVVTRGRGVIGGGISNNGTLTLINCSVMGNFGDPPSMLDLVGGAGIVSIGTLTVMNSTISGNTVTGMAVGGGILSNGTLTIMNSTISGNTAADANGGGGIVSVDGTVSLVNSTISGNTVAGIAAGGGILSWGGTLTARNTLVVGDCSGDIVSDGYNIESAGNTCSFDQESDQVDVTEEELNLGELADNGGPTMTHALLTGSIAIDRIPEGDCAVDADQRHVSRPRGDGCDVGAVEVDLACVDADVGSECTHRNFTGVCGADMCWATDCSELRDGINCLLPRNRVVFPGRCEAGSCDEEAVFP